MSRIKSKDTSIEVSLRKALWNAGIRYRKNYRQLPGSPDIAITKHRIAVFCDGEFWHGKDWDIKKPRMKSNRDYWVQKIERNIDRDRKTDRDLFIMDWVVIRFWGSDIQNNLSGCISEIIYAILQNELACYDDP
jgi:DNA mismatch endonuclease (patch repair protein)